MLQKLIMLEIKMCKYTQLSINLYKLIDIMVDFLNYHEDGTNSGLYLLFDTLSFHFHASYGTK